MFILQNLSPKVESMPEHCRHFCFPLINDPSFDVHQVMFSRAENRHICVELKFLSSDCLGQEALLQEATNVSLNDFRIPSKVIQKDYLCVHCSDPNESGCSRIGNELYTVFNGLRINVLPMFAWPFMRMFLNFPLLCSYGALTA